MQKKKKEAVLKNRAVSLCFFRRKDVFLPVLEQGHIPVYLSVYDIVSLAFISFDVNVERFYSNAISCGLHLFQNGVICGPATVGILDHEIRDNSFFTGSPGRCFLHGFCSGLFICLFLSSATLFGSRNFFCCAFCQNSRSWHVLRELNFFILFHFVSFHWFAVCFVVNKNILFCPYTVHERK